MSVLVNKFTKTHLLDSVTADAKEVGSMFKMLDVQDKNQIEKEMLSQLGADKAMCTYAQ